MVTSRRGFDEITLSICGSGFLVGKFIPKRNYIKYLLVGLFVVSLVFQSNVSTGAELGQYDLYINGEKVAETVPVRNPLNFVPRGIDFDLNSPRWNGRMKLVPRNVDPRRHGVATGVSEIVYTSLSNPYYGKVTWRAPVEWERLPADSVPLVVETNGLATDRLRWIDVLVEGEEVIFRENFEDTYQAGLDLAEALESQEELTPEMKADGIPVELSVVLFDDFGNSVSMRPRKIRLVFEEG